jgi:hypothetical protein
MTGQVDELESHCCFFQEKIKKSEFVMELIVEPR